MVCAKDASRLYIASKSGNWGQEERRRGVQEGGENTHGETFRMTGKSDYNMASPRSSKFTTHTRAK